MSPALADGGYKRLFSKAKGIPTEDQIAIYDQLKLKFAKAYTAPDGSLVNQFIPEHCEDPAPYEVEVTDLNSDGVPEVFVSGGDSCTSGATGGSIWLFVKSSSGYQMHLGFPAGVWKALPEKSKGFPDLRFVDAGHREGVWRWNGREYDHFRDVATATGGCNNR